MNIMMSIAYSTSAEMEPICMAWAPTRSAPTHMMVASTTFMRKNVMESVTAKTRFTRMALLAYSVKVSSRRARSWGSLPKARMTRTPVMDSRRRVFMLSMKPWRRVKMGADLATAATETAMMASVTDRSTQPMTTSVENASQMEITHAMGTGKIMRMDMSSVCCTTLASESVRVIMEPVPKALKSEPEKASEWS